MYDLSKIDLGKDEAEQDSRLSEYFLKTAIYQRAIRGERTIIIGRKGSGKSAIFRLMGKELDNADTLVIPITPDQYSWSALNDYQESGILPVQSHTNAWKLTLLAAVIWKLNEGGFVHNSSKLVKYYQYLRDSYIPGKDSWFANLTEKAKKFLNGVKTEWISFDWGAAPTIATPLRITEEMKSLLLSEWPKDKRICILIDRLDDSWDGSQKSQDLIIGLLKASNELNSFFHGKLIITTFIRSDIYSNLYFDDQDKLRQYEDTIFWTVKELKSVVCERVRVSLALPESNCDIIWQNLFSSRPYRSKSTAEKYIIDRTFKRPRDIISFIRFAIQVAIQNGNQRIEPLDTQIAEESYYSESKYRDLIIEYHSQVPYIRNLLDSFSDFRHKMSKKELVDHLSEFIAKENLTSSPLQLLRQLFVWGVIGVKRQGRYGVRQIGGAHFFYYYDDASIDPLRDSDYYIHPALRFYLHISEKRERTARVSEAKK